MKRTPTANTQIENCHARLKAFMEKRIAETSLTDAQIARNAGHGLTASAITKLRNSPRPNPRLDTFVALARGFGMLPETMMLYVAGKLTPEALMASREWELARRLKRLRKPNRLLIETLLGILEAQELHGQGIENNDNGGK